MALTKITKTGIGADAIDATKLGDDVISDEHLDVTAITGHTDLGENAATGDYILIYDTSAGVLKKVSAGNVGVQPPTISSVSPTSVVSGDGTGNYTFTITGTGFTGGSANLINTSGSTVNFDSVTVNSATQITGVIAKSSLPGSGEPYDVKVTASNNLTATLTDQINVDASPTFVTASGLLGEATISTAGSFSVNATDPESAGNVTFELQSGSLPPGYSITNTAADGGTAIISGTDNVTTGSTTTFNFVLRAVDAASNTSSRSFSIRSKVPISESFTSSGTFSVPAGVTTVDVLVVAGGGGGAGRLGGGGGAGGLIYRPGFPVTPGGTVSVTVGCGGAGGNWGPGGPGAGSPGFGVNGQDSVFGTLTAKGGGYGTGGSSGSGPGGPGGSGGGGRISSEPGGSATQPTQPGDSGAYGFGNAGGAGAPPAASPFYRTGGGGGAGAAGTNGADSVADASLGAGGIGKAYTIADGTTPVYYAGGGAGGGEGPGPIVASTGGQGGGGNSSTDSSTNVNAQSGTANRGGGGGGGTTQDIPSDHPVNLGGSGGKGIVIVRYS